MKELYDLVLAGADPATNKIMRWRGTDPRDGVVRRFSVTVCERTISNWLRRCG